MVRKQPYLRHALDRFLSGVEASARPGADAAALEFLEEAQRFSAEHRFPEGWRFDRPVLQARRGRPSPKEVRP